MKAKGGKCFMNEKILKILGVVTTILGVGVSLITNWIGDKNLDNKVNEAVAKALAETAKKIES